MVRSCLFGMLLAGAMALAPLSATAQGWGHIVQMASPSSNTIARLCSGMPDGFGKYFDIHCPSYAPSITTAGDVSVTGNLSAAQFIGDGSLLTGVGASSVAWDSILSIPAQVQAVSSSGDITMGLVSATNALNSYYLSSTVGWIGSLTANGAGIGSLNATRVSVTNDLNTLYLSATTAYVGSLSGDVVSSTTVNGHYASFTTLWAGALTGDGSGLTGIGSGDRITSGTTNITAYEDTSLTFTTDGTQRMVIDERGNVGVGTAAPLAKMVVQTATQYDGFHVRNGSNVIGYIAGNTGTNDDGQLSLLSGGATKVDIRSSGFSSFVGGNVGVGIITPRATLQVSGSFVVSTSAQTTTPSLYVGTNGNVGVGTSGPGYTLDVSGTIRSRSTNSMPFGYIMTNLNGSSGSFLSDFLISGNANYNYLGNYQPFPLVIITSNTERMRIDSLGNVGIGTTNLNAKLTVMDASANYEPSLTYLAPAGAIFNNALQELALGTDANPPYATWLQVRRHDDSGQALAINPLGGNVGIGTTDPNAKLDLFGTISSTGLTVTGIVTATYFEGDGSRLTNLPSGGGSAGTTDRISSTGDEAMVRTFAGGTVSFTTGGVGGTSYLDSTGRWIGPGISITTNNGISSTNGYFTGNVGVGTSTPNSKLVSVQNFGDAHAANLQARASGTGQGELAGHSFYPTFVGTGDNGPRRAADIWSGFNTGAWGGQYLAFGVGSGGTTANDTGNMTIERMRIRADGSVGIGIVTPTATLQISGSFIVSTSAQTTTPSLYVGTDGNVGVGTTAPSSQLTVAGNYSKSSGSGSYPIAVTTNDASNPLQLVLGIAPNATAASRYASIAAVEQGVAYRALSLNSFGGNVGIATTSPLAKLDVNGDISVSGVIDVGHTDLACSSTISGSIRFEAVSDTLQVCTGGGWKSLVSGTGVGGGDASVAGNDTNVQFNDNGALAGVDNFTFISATGIVSVTGISATHVSVTLAEFSAASVTGASGLGGNFILSGTTTVSASNDGKVKVATGDTLRLTIDSTGATFTGNVVTITPTADDHAATKAYVDAAVASGGGGGYLKLYNSSDVLLGYFAGYSTTSLARYFFPITSGSEASSHASPVPDMATTNAWFTGSNCSGTAYSQTKIDAIYACTGSGVCTSQLRTPDASSAGLSITAASYRQTNGTCAAYGSGVTGYPLLSADCGAGCYWSE